MPFWTQSTAEAFERAMNWVRITILSCNPDSQVEWGCVNTHHADCSILMGHCVAFRMDTD